MGFLRQRNIGTVIYTFQSIYVRGKDTHLNNSEIHRFCLFTNKFGLASTVPAGSFYCIVIKKLLH